MLPPLAAASDSKYQTQFVILGQSNSINFFGQPSSSSSHGSLTLGTGQVWGRLKSCTRGEKIVRWGDSSKQRSGFLVGSHCTSPGNTRSHILTQFSQSSGCFPDEVFNHRDADAAQKREGSKRKVRQAESSSKPRSPGAGVNF